VIAPAVVRVESHDLKAQYVSIKAEIDEAITTVLHAGEFERGEELWRFEEEAATYCGAAHAVGVGSGEAALFLALRALEIGPGDEVVTVPNTDISTVAAISHTGARPVFVDVDEQTHCIDVSAAEAALTPRTKAIVAVHLYGLPADLGRLVPAAHARGVAVVEDAALAWGAELDGRRVGAIGDVGCFSFAPHKILGAYGDGGLVVTQSADIARAVRLLGGYGEPFRESMQGPDGRFTLLAEGYHSHLDLLQAAVLRVKLRHVGRWIEARRRLASVYDEAFAGTPVRPSIPPSDATHVYRSYVVRVPERDRVRALLAEQGVETLLLYVPPLHLQPVYESLGRCRGSFPVAERLADELLCLPLYPELPDDIVREVAAATIDAVQRVS
jgi:dTDP-4-amino-4,6-dideoxygalactose transaminase